MRIKNLLSNIYKSIFPPFCIACGTYINNSQRQGWRVCEACENEIKIKKFTHCSQCGKRLFFAFKKCHPKPALPVYAAVSYNDKRIRKILHALKYENSACVYPVLRRVIKQSLTGFDLNEMHVKKYKITVTPIPLHRKKERERGFNQASDIAKMVLDELRQKFPHHDFAFKPEILSRFKYGKAQAVLKNHEDRHTNIKGAFAAAGEAADKSYLILVDDVFTSGATIQEAVRTLSSKHKFRGISAFVLAD